MWPCNFSNVWSIVSCSSGGGGVCVRVGACVCMRELGRCAFFFFLGSSVSNEQLFYRTRQFMGWLPASLRAALNCPFLAKTPKAETSARLWTVFHLPCNPCPPFRLCTCWRCPRHLWTTPPRLSGSLENFLFYVLVLMFFFPLLAAS